MAQHSFSTPAAAVATLLPLLIPLLLLAVGECAGGLAPSQTSALDSSKQQPQHLQWPQLHFAAIGPLASWLPMALFSPQSPSPYLDKTLTSSAQLSSAQRKLRTSDAEPVSHDARNRVESVLVSWL
jgi:hypothetical protein